MLCSFQLNIFLRVLVFCSITLFLPAAFAGPFEEPLPNLTKIAPDNVISLTLANISDRSGAIQLQTRADFKIYAKGLQFQIRSQNPFPTPIEVLATPHAKNIMDPWYNEPRDVYENGTRFAFSLKELPQPQDVFLVRFEACSVNSCLLPTTFQISPQVGAKGVWIKSSENDEQLGIVLPNTSGQPEIKAPDAKSLLALPQTSESAAQPSFNDVAHSKVNEYLQTRSPLLFPMLLLAGFLMNLTPCVYPLIPITLNVLSRFGAHPHSASQKRRRKLLPLIYVLGIALSYAMMGVVAAMTGKIFGSLLQSQLVSIGLAALMFVLGLWMLGVFSGAMLQNLGNKMPVSERFPKTGVFVMGAVSGLVAAPCTGPVLSTILLLISQTRDPLYGFTLMIFFSLGFGSPYLVLGTLSQEMRKLPRIGGTMQLIKYVFAALMFALSAYYLKPILGESVSFIYQKPSFSIVFNVFLVVALAFVSMKFGKSKTWNRILRLTLMIGLSQLALWMTLSATSAFVASSAPLAEQVITSQNKVQHGEYWLSDWETAVAMAKQQNKILVVDAWAEWCAACLKMDATTWKDPSVTKLIREKAIAVKVDFTNFGEVSDAITKRWELTGLPAIGFFGLEQDPQADAPKVLIRQAAQPQEIIDAINGFK